MIRFSTDDISPERRFDEWREVRGRGLFGVTIELPAERRHAFQGSFWASRVGLAVASEMKASSYHVSRTRADIARLAGDSLCIALQVRGSGSLDAGGSRLHGVTAGDMTISHSDLPYIAAPGDLPDFHYRMLKVPLDGDLLLGGTAHDLFALRYIDDPALSRPFRALFDTLTGLAATDPVRDVIHITRLALAARGRLPRGMPEVRAALRSGLRHAAREIMVRRKHQQVLSPAIVAHELGVSLRQLHILFEEAEQTFSRTLAAMRLEDARRLLISAPGLPIIDIAYACGFESLPTFYRQFNAAYGMAPGDMRKTVLH